MGRRQYPPMGNGHTEYRYEIEPDSGQVIDFRKVQDITSRLDFGPVREGPHMTTARSTTFVTSTLDDGSLVAIETLLPGASSQRRRRMENSIAIWVECVHPNIPHLIGKAIIPGQGGLGVVYGWHEYQRLQCLSAPQYLECCPTTLADRYQLSTRICEAVAYMHANNMIHGNICSAQILVTDDGVPQLMPSFEFTTMINKTENTKSGTIRWAAPELFGETPNLTLANDIYALGMEIITNPDPYVNSCDHSQLFTWIAEGELRSRFTDTIPENDAGNTTWNLLSECLSPNPADRPSVFDVYDTLRMLDYQTLNDRPEGMIVGPEITIQDLVSHFEKHGQNNYTDPLGEVHIATTSPCSDTVLANVYKINLSGQGYVAVKCVKHVNPHKMLKRAARELSCWSSHKHENILPVLGFAVVKDNLAMVAPWMSNGDVTQYVVRNPKCDRRKLCIQLARAISYLHESGVIHGDIKGPNVLISDEEMIQVADFGVSIMEHKEIEFSVTSTGRGTERWQARQGLDKY
ncbi:unnamed protein product [Rhizoctonia solani]|uniref:Protein kinase domain-containing protein n=1 Tax=Rhizoctonia solani TaxID=456999 RepID=A0A8H2XMH8_9AGAM|nr:unnamed protein product [Rhizoctonia solani]